MTHYTKFTIDTQREGMYNMSDHIRQAIQDSGVREGFCVVFAPHTTTGLTINENSDPDVQRDFLYAMGEISPDRPQFRHDEGNSDAHVKASLMGASVTLLIRDGQPILGTWQAVYLCEFDGPRTRTIHVQVLGE